MHFQYTPYALPPLISAIVILALAIFALRHRDVRGALPFSICMLLTELWSGGYALELAGTDLPTKLFWARVEYIGYAFDPVVWLIMVFLFTGRDHWVTRRNMLPLFVPAVLTVLLACTNGLHGLVWRNAHLDTNGPITALGRTFGPLFWAIFAFSWLVAIASVPLLFLSLRRRSGFYKEQARALFVALGLLFVPDVFFNLWIYPLAPYDLTPVAAGVGGLIIGWSMFRHRLFDIVPVARENIIENMLDALIIMDGQNRIVDLNLAARNIFGLSFRQAVGKDAAVFFEKWPVLAGLCRDREKSPGEVVIAQDGLTRTFEVSASSLRDKQGMASGLSILLRDVTERRMAHARLLEQQRALAAGRERERLARELHDSLGQVLGFINVQSQAAREQIVRGRVDAAVDSLDRLGRIARDTHNDVREYIQSVRGIAAAEQDLGTALQNYLDQYNRNYGIRTDLNVSDNSLLGRIEPAAARQVLRIIQESLANVRKHAGAGSVTITFTEKQGYVQVTIEDDGCGFTLEDKADGQRFGLGIMRERAQEAGGALAIKTKPGQGTRLEIEIPVSGGRNARERVVG